MQMNPPIRPPKWPMFEVDVGKLKARKIIQEKMNISVPMKTGRERGKIYTAIATSADERIITVRKTFSSANIGRLIPISMSGKSVNAIKIVGIFSIGLVSAATAIRPNIAPDAPTKGMFVGIPNKSLLRMSKIAAMHPDAM